MWGVWGGGGGEFPRERWDGMVGWSGDGGGGEFHSHPIQIHNNLHSQQQTKCNKLLYSASLGHTDKPGG